jgi:hypothetical protein
MTRSPGDRRHGARRTRIVATAVLAAAAATPGWLSASGAGAQLVTAAQESPADTSTDSTTDSTSDSTTDSAGVATTDHDHATTTTSSAPGGTTTTTTGGSGHDHEDPGEPGDPGHHDPSDDFPEEWTPEQVAFAERLIADTDEALERYANPAVLPLLGFGWIGDGLTEQTYQHWVNLGWMGDGHLADPLYPESVVFRVTENGPVLEAAMYMLPAGTTMETIPEELAWLPGWHVHDNLCFEGLRVVDIIEEGETGCERGTLLITPPMFHVWVVDTPCGRFAGVDEGGLICDHDHEH